MRGLFGRDHNLLGLLSQTAYAAILKTFQAVSQGEGEREHSVSDGHFREYPIR